MMQHIAAQQTKTATLGIFEADQSPEPYVGKMPEPGSGKNEEFRQYLRDKDSHHTNPVEPRRPQPAQHDKQQVRNRDDVEQRQQTAQESHTQDKKPVQRTQDDDNQVKADKTADASRGNDEAQVETKEANADDVQQDSQSEHHEHAAESDNASSAEQPESETESEIDWLALLQSASASKLKLSKDNDAGDQSSELQVTEGAEERLQDLARLLMGDNAEDADGQNALLDEIAALLKASVSEGTSDDQQKPDLSVIQNKLSQWFTMQEASGTESKLTDSDLVKDALDVELLAAMLPVKDGAKADVSPKTVSDASTDKPTDTLATLLNASDDQLEQALQNLAARLDDSMQRDAQQSDLFTKGQPLKPEAGLFTQQTKRDFVAHLKAQLANLANSETGGNNTDLNKLVGDALNQVMEQGQLTDMLPEQISQALASFDRAMNASQQLNRQLDSQSPLTTLNIDKANQRTAASTAALEQSKQQAMADKPINILRPEGQQQLAEKVRFMVSQNNMQADIRLDPPDLGSVKVRVNLSGESASVNFVVQSQQAREALEHAAPRLKELLEEQGIELGQSSVEQDNQSENTDEDAQLASQSGELGHADEEQSDMVTEQPVVNGRLGGIDYFV